MRLGRRRLGFVWGRDATAPDSGFNRIIGEGKIRERERRKKKGGRREGRRARDGRDSDIGTEKAKPACYCSSLSDALSVRERRRRWREETVAQMPIWDGDGGGDGGSSQLPWMTRWREESGRWCIHRRELFLNVGLSWALMISGLHVDIILRILLAEIFFSVQAHNRSDNEHF